ncbi:hypothetical protein MLD38_021421 [Melastoma candidum]|uniref:Uncharacterized protein n=1 Tax=Melastoma candidum TaxID=119954 RepID=A0ACB9QIX8_9MYRT|nr:hypothetical protein MLD38_021421 [Melastoma candidum]
MRIRKRQIPLPLSSLSPVPLTDPLFFDIDDRYDREPPAVEVKGEASNDSGAPDGKGTTSSATIPVFPSESKDANRWHEEDKALLSPNRRWPSLEDVCDEERGTTGGKRRGRDGGTSGMSMEGSRCSRVNGRGWRCGRQTLVGYSLCEHHLGKGRLRSTTSVRGSARSVVGATSRKVSEKPCIDDADPPFLWRAEDVKSFADDNKVGEEADEVDEKEDSTEVGKKKARSMSSLLRQGPDYADDSIQVLGAAGHVVEEDSRS